MHTEYFFLSKNVNLVLKLQIDVLKTKKKLYAKGL